MMHKSWCPSGDFGPCRCGVLWSVGGTKAKPGAKDDGKIGLKSPVLPVIT